MNELKRKEHIPKELLKISNNTNCIKTDKSGKINASSIQDDDEFSEFIDYDVEEQSNKFEFKEKKARGNNISVQDFGIPISEGESESEDESE